MFRFLQTIRPHVFLALALFVIILLLSACNLPAELHDNEGTLATPSVEFLTAPPTLSPSETPTATPFDAVAAAATDMPGAVQTLIAPLAGASATNTATATPIPTTPTAIPEDAIFKKGAPSWAPSLEELDTALGFFDLHFEARKAEDGFRLISHGPANWSNYPTYPVNVQDGFFELDFRFVACNNEDRLGITLRNQQGLHYYFSITCDGRWGFTYYTALDETIDLTEYQKSDLILKKGEVNRLGVAAKGSNFDFFINGKKIGSLEDTHIKYGGDAGLHIMSSKFAGLEAVVQHFTVWGQDE